MKFIVKPISKKLAVYYTSKHPHAPSLPNSSKYYLALFINNIFRGLAVWGYGIKPKQTPITLFGKKYNNNVKDYLELCRFFIDNDNVPQHTASKFLAINHRLLKKFTNVKYLFTYAAGFQGLIGTIYKASGYEHITKHKTTLIYIPEIKAMVHPMSFWHRYNIKMAFGKKGFVELKEIFPNAKIWCGHNYRYLYWLCDKKEKEKLMSTARFELVKPPTKEDIEIWFEDENGFIENIDLEFAKTIPIVKMQSKKHAHIA